VLHFIFELAVDVNIPLRLQDFNKILLLDPQLGSKKFTKKVLLDLYEVITKVSKISLIGNNSITSLAVLNNSLPLLKKIVEKKDGNIFNFYKNHEGSWPLIFIASTNGNLEVFQYLLTNGCDLKQVGKTHDGLEYNIIQYIGANLWNLDNKFLPFFEILLNHLIKEENQAFSKELMILKQGCGSFLMRVCQEDVKTPLVISTIETFVNWALQNKNFLDFKYINKDELLLLTLINDKIIDQVLVNLQKHNIQLFQYVGQSFKSYKKIEKSDTKLVKKEYAKGMFVGNYENDENVKYEIDGKIIYPEQVTLIENYENDENVKYEIDDKIIYPPEMMACVIKDSKLMLELNTYLSIKKESNKEYNKTLYSKIKILYAPKDYFISNSPLDTYCYSEQPLHLKFLHLGKLDLLKIVLEACNQLDMDSDKSILELIVMLNHELLLKSFFNKYKNSIKINDHFNGETILHQAIKQEKFEMVKIILQQKPDPEIKNSDGKTCLELANSSDEHIKNIVEEHHLKRQKIIDSLKSLKDFTTSEKEEQYEDVKIVEKQKTTGGAKQIFFNNIYCQVKNDEIQSSNIEQLVIKEGYTLKQYKKFVEKYEDSISKQISEEIPKVYSWIINGKKYVSNDTEIFCHKFKEGKEYFFTIDPKIKVSTLNKLENCKMTIRDKGFCPTKKNSTGVKIIKNSAGVKIIGKLFEIKDKVHEKLRVFTKNSYRNDNDKILVIFDEEAKHEEIKLLINFANEHDVVSKFENEIIGDF